AYHSLRKDSVVQLTLDEIARDEKCDRPEHDAEHPRIVRGRITARQRPAHLPTPRGLPTRRESYILIPGRYVIPGTRAQTNFVEAAGRRRHAGIQRGIS